MDISTIINRINWVDVIILILLLRICYVGFDRGLGREIVPTIGTFAALIIALQFYPAFGSFIAAHTPLSVPYGTVISYIIIIVAITFATLVIENAILSLMVKIHLVSLFDRLGGVVTGAIKAVLLVSIIVIALQLVPADYIGQSIESSLLGKTFLDIGYTVYDRTTALLRL